MVLDFNHVSISLSAECLDRLRDLCLSNREYGGRLNNDSCEFGCTNLNLVEGTALQANHADAGFYASEVQIAATPLYQEVFSVSSVCDSPHQVNIFFHTHPLFLWRGQTVGRVAPPSVGDFVAHGLLANYRNHKTNNVINTPLLIAREGLYYYNITPAQFAREMAVIERLVDHHRPSLSSRETEDLKVGELPMVIVDALKTRVHTQLQPIHDAFQQELDIWTMRHADELRLDNFDRAMSQDWFQGFCRNNILMTNIAQCGYTCVFIPGPFTDGDIMLACPTHYTKS